MYDNTKKDRSLLIASFLLLLCLRSYFILGDLLTTAIFWIMGFLVLFNLFYKKK